MHQVHHGLPSSSAINDSEHLRVFYAPLGVVCYTGRSNQEWENTLLRLEAVRFLLTSCYQQNRPSRPTFLIDYNPASTCPQLITRFQMAQQWF